MMGRQTADQTRLFYEFHLEDRVPANHLLRRINVFVTAALGDLHKELAPLLQPHRPSFDRSGVDDPDAASWATATLFGPSGACARRSRIA